MQEPREDEHHGAREDVAISPSPERGVDMPEHEVIDGFIPRAPVIPHGGAIPPIGVEFPVAEAHDFRQGVEGGLEDCEEACQPDY